MSVESWGGKETGEWSGEEKKKDKVSFAFPTTVKIGDKAHPEAVFDKHTP